jgi:hypothetical protein
MATKDHWLTPVNPVVADIITGLKDEAVIVLILKILHPERNLNEIAEEVWPKLGNDRRRQLITESRVTNLIEYLAQRPVQMAYVLATKLMPLAMAVLYDGLSAEKENVQVTAAKEIMRIGQFAAPRLLADDNEPLPTDAQDELLAGAEVRDAPGTGERVTVGAEHPLDGYTRVRSVEDSQHDGEGE